MVGIRDLMPTLWHFKIWEPEIDPDDSFRDGICHCLKKLSKLVELDSYEVNVEKGLAVAKVVRLRKSKIAIQQSKTFEDGIEPTSSVFQTYWTASFFNGILSQGPELIEEAPFRGSGQGKPYLAPTALAFAVAALGGIFDAFRMFQQLYSKPLTSVEDVQRTIKESTPTVESWLNWLFESEASESKSQEGTLDKQKLEERRLSYKKDLTRFTDAFDIFLESYKNIPAPLTNGGGADLRSGAWTCTICSNLCDMMTVASKLLRNNKCLIKARNQELTQAVQSGVFTAVSASMVWLNAASVAVVDAAPASATAVSATAPSIALFFLVGGTSILSALVSVNSFNKSQELNVECERLNDVFEAIISSSTKILNANITVQKFQHDRTKPSSTSAEKDSQGRWEQPIVEFDRMSLEHKNEGCSELELLMMYINEQGIALQKQRERLII
ncbi:unnamed protein product [Clonostachys byssicola]|uniref:Uncharacterized protein n=1 Tax=Clonostachys byssicola TaxID=160290 RepID=A0A9N9UXR6_9HYPO|nr:unnamed protein product [Clonostachys byssicola]